MVDLDPQTHPTMTVDEAAEVHPDTRPTLPDPLRQPTMTVDEAQPFYGLSRSAMFNAVKSGAIPSVRIGRRILLPTAAIRRQLGFDPS